jgi:RNA polymerase sigma factor (sigma-70 family)
MDQDTREQRLSRISTLWTLVYQAHEGSTNAVGAAQEALLKRYSGTILRYLRGAVRDADAADDLFQEFVLRFLRGDFKNADPGRGRFRNYLKTSLFHLVADYQRQKRARLLSLADPLPEPAAPAEEVTDSERAFLESRREDLLDRSWLALEQLERKTAQPCHTVLCLSKDHPELSSAELAEQLGGKLGKSFTVHAARQVLHRAREKFADLLLNEVVSCLENPTLEEVEQELIDLCLHSYCRAALDRRRMRDEG